MKKALRLFAALGLLCLAVTAAPVSAALPLCEGFHGGACPSWGAMKDCWWKKWGEPSVCYCLGTPLTWDCD